MDTNKNLKVLAVGAGGHAAGLVVPELLKRGVAVRGLVHSSKDEAAVRAQGVKEVVVGELSDADVTRRALDGMDAAFYIAPITLQNEAEVGKQFVAAAKDAGVRRIVFSSVIHPVLGELDNHAAKAPVEEALLDSGLEYVFLHPALFFQNFAAGWAKVKETGVYAEPWSNETRFSRVDYRDVAEVAAAALTEDRLLYGTFELCAEGHLDRHDVTALMGKVLGKPVTPKQVAPPTEGAEAQKIAKMFAWYDKHPLLGNALTLRAILGREPRDLKTYFTELNAQG